MFLAILALLAVLPALAQAGAWPGQPLAVGETVSSTLPAGSPYAESYYRLSVPGGHSAGVRLSLTVTAGDADLYVAFDPSGQPSLDAFDVKSTLEGLDTILLSQNATNVVIAVVSSSQAAHFSLTAIGRSPSVTALSLGSLLTAEAAVGTWTYFGFNNTAVNIGVALRFSLTFLSGDGSLSVRADDGVSMPTVLPPNTLPQWVADEPGSNAVTVYTADVSYCSSCWYIAAVYTTSDASFTLSVTALHGNGRVGDAIALVPGLPMFGELQAGHSQRYLLTSLAGNGCELEDETGDCLQRMRIWLTRLLGEPTLLANSGALGGAAAWPTDDEDARWATGHGKQLTEGAILLSEGQPGFLAQGEYYIVVRNLGTHLARFSLAASPRPYMQQLLQSGLPSLERHIHQGDTHLFALQLPQTDAALQFSLLQLDGGIVKLVLGRDGLPPTCMLSDIGSMSCSNWTWLDNSADSVALSLPVASDCFGHFDFMRAQPCPPAGLTPGPLYVAVVGVSDATYTLAASVAGAPLQLQEGQPVMVSMQWQDMCMEWSLNGLTCLRYQLQLFSTSTFVTEGHDYPVDDEGDSADVGEPDMSITVRHRCPQSSSFCDSSMRLRIYVGACLAGQCSAADRLPGPTRSAFASDSGSDTVYIPNDHPNFCRSTLAQTCRYFVNVIAPPGASTGWYDITLSSFDSPTVLPWECLVDGASCPAVLEAVPPNEYRDYQLVAGNTPLNMLMTLEACLGEPVLYVCDSSCTNGTRWATAPTAHNFRWRARRDDQLGAVDLRLVGSRQLWASVYASDGMPALYKLRVGTTTLPRLELPSTLEVLRVKLVERTTVQVEWDAALLRAADANESRVVYTVYVLRLQPNGQLFSTVAKAVPDTACGLAYAAEMDDTEGITVEKGKHMARVSGLQHNTLYLVNVVASCDAKCLGMDYGDDMAYAPRTIATAAEEVGELAGLEEAGLVLVIVGVLLCQYLVYLQHRGLKLRRALQYEMHDVRAADGDGGTASSIAIEGGSSLSAADFDDSYSTEESYASLPSDAARPGIAARIRNKLAGRSSAFRPLDGSDDDGVPV